MSFRTMFVGPPDSFCESALAEYEDVLDRFVNSRGYIDQEADALDALADGDLDVVVVFPPDPLAAIAAGRSAVIRVLHNEVDPIQTTAVAIAAQLAVQEVNTSVLATIASGAQSVIRPR